VRRVNGPPTSALMLQDGSLHDCNLSLALKFVLEDEGSFKNYGGRNVGRDGKTA
jgi:hypothetical protein